MNNYGTFRLQGVNSQQQKGAAAVALATSDPEEHQRRSFITGFDKVVKHCSDKQKFLGLLPEDDKYWDSGDTSTLRSIADNLTCTSKIKLTLSYIDRTVEYQNLDVCIGLFTEDLGCIICDVLFYKGDVICSFMITQTQPLVLVAHYKMDPLSYAKDVNLAPCCKLNRSEYIDDPHLATNPNNKRPLKVQPVRLQNYSFQHPEVIQELHKTLVQRNVERI
jgi:hypothetical protein